MRTLRSRLLIYTAATTSIVLLAAGLAVFFLMRAALLAEFDGTLVSAARALQAASEQRAGRIKIEAASAEFPEYSRRQSPDYFQAWLDDGVVAAKSGSLAGNGLPRPLPGSSDSAFSFLTLPDGQPGRQVVLRFIPPTEDEGEPKQNSYRPLSVTLAVACHTSLLDTRLRTLRWLLIVVGLAATTVAAFTMWAAVSRGLRPLGVLAGRIGQIGRDNLGQQVEIAGTPAELTVVVRRLNELLGRIKEAISRERAFTADVAHELRTPLGGLESILEVCSMRPRTTGEYEVRVGKALKIARTMHAMVDNLLTLARADAGQLPVTKSKVELRPLVDECWAHFEPRAQARGLAVRIDTAESCVDADSDKLRMVLHNLMDNAVSYCDPGGQIEISSKQSDGTVEIRVSNAASGINRVQLPHIFDRFWRGDASRTRTELHCGLGLSLCQTMVKLMGAQISADVSDRIVFTVILRFPNA